MIVKDMELKEIILKNAEERIKNNVKPDPNFTTDKTNLGYWLEELFNLAFLQGEISGMRTCKAILHSDVHEIENIEKLGKEQMKKNSIQ